MSKNPIAAMIVAKAKPAADGPMGDSQDQADSMDDEGLTAAATDILSAIDKRDPSALMNALKSFCQMCDQD